MMKVNRNCGWLLLVLMACVKVKKGVIQENEKCIESRVLFKEPKMIIRKAFHQDSLNYRFSYYNVGNCPLRIFDIKTSCGCTVPSWNPEIFPGDSSHINLIMHLDNLDSVKSVNVAVIMNTKEKYHRLTLKYIQERSALW